MNNLELHNLRDMHWVPINTIPRSISRCLDTLITYPNSTVTLKSAPKRYLPNPIPFLHSPFGLYIRQFIPQTRRRRVAESMQSHSRSFHMFRRKPQILLQFINNCSTAGVYAKMLKGHFKIRDVGFDFRIEDFPADQAEKKEELF